MKDSFNSNFYITAATVIPLLYITLFLQGQMIQNLQKRMDRLYYSGERTSRYRFLILNLRGSGFYIILTMALAGIAAEALSLWALYFQSDSTAIRAIVLGSMLGLLVLVAASPIITIMRNLFSGTEPDASDEEPDST
jgi:hypothetical protein